MKVYFASPFFNEEQIEREERLKAKLRSLGFDVWSPKENCLCKPNESMEVRKKTFDDNCQNILSSDIIFVVTDGKDVGTIWEAGFAYGIKYLFDYSPLVERTKIVYYCETLPEGGNFNLMLAESGDMVFTSFESLDMLPFCLEKGLGVKYAGNIE